MDEPGKLTIPKVFRRFDKTRARYKGAYGGRGTGKSHYFATRAVLMASTIPIRFLCCREIQKSIKESVKQTIESKIVKAKLQNVFHVTQNEITSTAGAQFIFEGLHNNITRIQSLEKIGVCWIEEAQSISQRSLDILRPTIREPGSEIWASWNPYSPKDPIDRLFREPGAADPPSRMPDYYDEWMISEQIEQKDNPYFPAELEAEMDRDRTRDPDKFRHVWLGHYASRSNAAVFRNWRIGVVEVPKGTRPYYGADWGFSVDPTVLVRCFVFPDQRVLFIDAEVGGVGIEIDKTPAYFDSIVDDQSDPLHPRRWAITSDSSRPETISYMVSHGYPKIERARKGPGSVEEGIEFLKSYDIVINPNCKRVIDEFTAYRYEIDKHTEEVLPTLADKDNHTIDAVRYAVEGIRRATVITGFPIVVTQPRVSFGSHPGGY